MTQKLFVIRPPHHDLGLLSSSNVDSLKRVMDKDGITVEQVEQHKIRVIPDGAYVIFAYAPHLSQYSDEDNVDGRIPVETYEETIEQLLAKGCNILYPGTLKLWATMYNHLYMDSGKLPELKAKMLPTTSVDIPLPTKWKNAPPTSRLLAEVAGHIKHKMQEENIDTTTNHQAEVYIAGDTTPIYCRNGIETTCLRTLAKRVLAIGDTHLFVQMQFNCHIEMNRFLVFALNGGERILVPNVDIPHRTAFKHKLKDICESLAKQYNRSLPVSLLAFTIVITKPVSQGKSPLWWIKFVTMHPAVFPQFKSTRTRLNQNIGEDIYWKLITKPLIPDNQDQTNPIKMCLNKSETACKKQSWCGWWLYPRSNDYKCYIAQRHDLIEKLVQYGESEKKLQRVKREDLARMLYAHIHKLPSKGKHPQSSARVRNTKPCRIMGIAECKQCKRCRWRGCVPRLQRR